ncbi:hypothetical protein [Pelosinus sp. sgz500959]|uniref:hypothetical protein n=1 Tax=Pelosinus sp. sgz500959 TaxID=3242472 RepID=UPI00366A8179
MNPKLPQSTDADFNTATKRAMRVRRLYQQLEVKNHKTIWTTEEDMLAFVSDVGILARLVMASEGRWVHGGDVHAELGSKIAECQWWLLVLSDRLGINITEEFTSFMDKLDTEL